jgi:hypothetical protein
MKEQMQSSVEPGMEEQRIDVEAFKEAIESRDAQATYELLQACSRLFVGKEIHNLFVEDIQDFFDNGPETEIFYLAKGFERIAINKGNNTFWLTNTAGEEAKELARKIHFPV